MKYHRKNRGFTLIELLVVIAIIGLVSGVITQSLMSSRVKARNNIRINQIDQIHKALEISATSGTNKLPYSGGSWVCLGNTTPCAGTPTYTNNSTVNSAIASGISGGTVSSIPKDPLFTSGLGDAYLYNSNLNPDSTVGGCATAGACPAGVYLSWISENSAVCGRGVYWGSGPTTNGYQCILRIGNSVTN